MELTPEGLWIDPGAISPESLMALPGTTLEGLIECGCNDCGLRYNPLPTEPYFGDAFFPMDTEMGDPIEPSPIAPTDLPRRDTDDPDDAVAVPEMIETIEMLEVGNLESDPEATPVLPTPDASPSRSGNGVAPPVQDPVVDDPAAAGERPDRNADGDRLSPTDSPQSASDAPPPDLNLPISPNR
jgi:hypothetical protein